MSDLVHNNEHFALAKSFGVKELGEILDKAMTRKSEFKQKKSFAPSSFYATGRCPRYWKIAFDGAVFDESGIKPSMLSNMEAGTDAGKRIVKIFERAGLYVSDEDKIICDDPPIFGFMDILVNWKGEEVPVEVKTTKDTVWHNRVRTNSVPTYQLLQLLMYMKILGKDKGFFVTENKDTHKLFILPVKMSAENKQFVDGVFDWLRSVYANIKEGKLPTRPFTQKSSVCKSCPVRMTCWEELPEGEITIPALTIPK